MKSTSTILLAMFTAIVLATGCGDTDDSSSSDSSVDEYCEVLLSCWRDEYESKADCIDDLKMEMEEEEEIGCGSEYRAARDCELSLLKQDCLDDEDDTTCDAAEEAYFDC